MAVQLTFTVPDAHVADFQEALEELALGDEKIMMIAMSGNSRARAEVDLIERGDGENALAFGKRILRKIFMGAVGIGKFKLGQAQYDLDVAAIPEPSAEVDNELISE